MKIINKIRYLINSIIFTRKMRKYEKLYRGTKPRIRPERVEIEAEFDNFVEKFGGKKLSDQMQNRANLPSNADYIFYKENVIAELKSIEGIFSGESAVNSLFQTFFDAGLDGDTIRGVVFRGEKMPDKAAYLIRRRIRRGLEERIKYARRQLRTSKSMFGNDSTFCLILISMEQFPLFGQHIMLSEIAKLMASNFSDEHVDGIVYFNPNTPTKFTEDGMEYGGWYPMYRDENVNENLSDFVNKLGAEWLKYYSELIGEQNPILELKSFEEVSLLFR